MKQYINKADVEAELEKRRSRNSRNINFIASVEDDYLLFFLDTLEVIDPYEQCVQYDSIKTGIQAHAETYSFNIESELFNQLTTEEQQGLWRKEIEQAYVSGGEVGVELARDPRYKENLEVKEVVFETEWKKYFEHKGNLATVNVKNLAKHFFEFGLKAQKGE